MKILFTKANMRINQVIMPKAVCSIRYNSFDNCHELIRKLLDFKGISSL